jgi:hypothetical protein
VKTNTARHSKALSLYRLDAAPALSAHVGGLAAQEGAGEVHVEDAAPLLFVQVRR